MKRILLFADVLMIPTNQRDRSGDVKTRWNRIFTEKAFSCKLLFVLLLFSAKNYGQCTFPTGATQVGSTIIYCIDNSGTISNNVPAGRFVLLNVVQGFTYRFRVDDNFGGTNNNEIVSIYNAENNNGLTTSAGSGGVDFNWTATLSGQVKVLISRGGTAPSGCVNDGSAFAQLRINLISIGNTIDDPTIAGTNTWRGHIYNWTGTAPPGGTPSPSTPPSTNPFSASQYAGYYDVGTETIPTNFNFNGDTGCFNVFSNGTQRATIYPEQFAVRYRMKSTRPAGCYIVSVQGDDGVRLYVDNVLVFDEWEEQSPTTYQSILVYLDGDSDFILDYYENGGQNVVSFSITPFVASSNSIVAPTPSTVCSGVTPGVINGSSYTYNGSVINPTIRYQWQTATSASGPWSNVTTGTAEDYTPAARTTTGADIRYYKRVVSATAAYASACTWDSNVISITTGANTAPVTPTTTAGTNVSCSSFTANWNTETTATSYRLDVSPSSTFASSVTTYNVGLVTSFNVIGLAVGTTYYYRVRSFNGCSNQVSGNSTVQAVIVQNPSASISGTATVCQNAASPNITFTNPRPSAITVTYRVNGGANQTINVGANTTANVAAPTTTSGTFAYSLVSVAYQSAPTCSAAITGTATITVNSLSVAPTGILGTTTICSGGSTTLTISGGSAGTGATAQWFSGSCGSTDIGTGNAITVSPTSNTTYFVRYNGTCNITTCASVTVSVSPAPAPPVLSNITLTCNQTTASQTWNASSNTSNYIVDVFSDAALTSYLAGYQNRPVTPSASSTESLSINGLLAGQTYYMRVKAVSSCGIESAYSNIATISLAISQSSDGVTWDNGGLTVNKIAKFTGSSNINVSSAVTACSCIVDPNVNVVIKSPGELILENGLDVKGTLVFENNTSLKQTNPSALNTGSIEYKRTSSAMQNFDFTYWSSPVANQNIVALSPNTLSDKYFRWDPLLGWVLHNNPTTSAMIPGTGYIIRVPKPGTYLNGETWSGATPYAQPVTFKGVPNNGDITFTVGSNQYNLVGNPYPSAIDATKFMQDNSGIIYGPLYFWTHNTPIANNAYTANDYATYTLLGGTGTAGNLSPEWIDHNNNKIVESGEYTELNGNASLDKGNEWIDTDNDNVVDVGEWTDLNANGKLDLPLFEVTVNKPTGKIAAGQSFFVGTQPVIPANSKFVFKNSQREVGNNDKFFKQTSTKKTTSDEKNRVWLNLTNSQGAFKQLLVGYIAGATNDWDNLYDGPTFDGQPFVDFYSINQGKNLTIQGRALPFEATDEVPLGYRSTIAGPFEISIDARDGNLAQQEIWLEDKKTATLHDLTKGKYIFTAINGVENSRFVLKYTNKTLGTDDNTLEDTSLVISIKNKKITVNSSEETITQIQIFDLLGRKIYDKSKINAQEYMIEALPSSEQALIVKTTLANGAISSKKIIF